MEVCDASSVRRPSIQPEIYAFRMKKYYNAIVRDIEPKKIIGFLYQEEIFDDDDLDEVRSERTRKKQAETMLSLLKRTDRAKAYQVLVEALEEKQPHLARILNTPVPDEVLENRIPSISVSHQSGQPMEEIRRMVQYNLSTNEPQSMNEPVEQGERYASSGPPNPNAQTERGMPVVSGENTGADFAITPTDFDYISQLYRPHTLDSVYKMTSSPRGITVIINIENFEPDPKKHNQRQEELTSREGSKVDTEDLEKLFRALDFKVEKIIDKPEKEIREELLKISKRNMEAYDCFVMCIMSHGKGDYFYAYDGGKIKIMDVKQMFDNGHCKSLCQKPKLFFIQACRGKLSDFGRTVSDAPSEHNWNTEDKPSFCKPRATISYNADILLAYSTVEGYTSYRNTATGSRFIRCLIQVFKNYAGIEDVESMMTRVISAVNRAGELNAKQVPKPETTLTKKVFFWPGLKF